VASFLVKHSPANEKKQYIQILKKELDAINKVKVEKKGKSEET
jgi:hypothetical protein